MIKTSVLKEGFDGCLFSVKDKKEKVMIVLTGSDGGMKTAKQIAGHYKKNGTPGLALGYFKTKHTGSNLSCIPIEYIEKAIAWLKELGYQKIGIDALSKGTEYAMFAAIKSSDVGCLILRAPSYYFSEGLCKGQPSGTSCWCFRGQELPYTAYRLRRIKMLQSILKTKEFSLLDINTGKKIEPASVIPIEEIHAPVLIISTKADTVWPSAESGEILINRLKENNFQYKYKYICLDHVSHMLVPILHRYQIISLKMMFRSERLYSEQCAVERNEMIKEINAWVSETLS